MSGAQKEYDNRFTAIRLLINSCVDSVNVHEFDAAALKAEELASACRRLNTLANLMADTED